MFFLTVLILYKIRSMLSQRPVCQTGLCESSSSGKTANAAEDKNTSSDGIEVADNRSLLSSEKEKKKDVSKEICILCQTISNLAHNIRKKFTIMILILLLFQVALEYEYWNQEKSFLMNEVKLPSRVDTNVIYSLYAFEFMILTSVFTARHIQGRSYDKGSKAIK